MMKSEQAVALRSAQRADLDGLNAVVTACIMRWDLPERVKRLTLNSYLYHSHDLDHLDILLAVTEEAKIVGVAAFEPAAPADLPKGQCGLSLHGLYVEPNYQHHGVGGRLVGAVLEQVRVRHLNGLLVKAQSGAVGFFLQQGFKHLPVEDPDRDYPHRYWMPLSEAGDSDGLVLRA
jgi:GNAT superfamily N-acetyltransferase